MSKLSRAGCVRALVSEAPFVRQQLRARGIRGEANLDDVTAQVLAAAILSLDRFEPMRGANVREALRAWLGGIARNLASHARERAYLWRERLDDGAVESAVSCAPLPDEVAVSRETLDLVLARIATLPAVERAVVLAVIDGETIAEYATRSGVQLMTAHHRIERARAKLRRLR